MPRFVENDLTGPVRFLNNKYLRWYSAIIENARPRKKQSGYEGHHAYPKCFGGTNGKSNIIYLTYREHFICHWLLLKFTTDRSQMKMRYALLSMCNMIGPTHKERILSSWQFELAKKNAAGYVHSEETRRKIGEKSKGRTSYWKGKNISEETKETLRKKATKQWANNELRSRHSEIMRDAYTLDRRINHSHSATERWRDPQLREKASRSASQRWSDPEQRRLSAEKTKAYFDSIAEYRTFKCLACDKSHKVRVVKRVKRFCNRSCAVTFAHQQRKSAKEAA